jgi:hypothetical protein
VQQTFAANVVNLRLPVVQGGNVRHKPFAFAILRVMRHELASNRHPRCDQPEFRDLFHRVIAPVQKREINFEIRRLLSQPLWNNVVRKAKERGKSVQRLWRAGLQIPQHSIIDRAIGLNSPQVAASIGFQRSQDVKCASTSQPGANFYGNLWRLCSTPNRSNQELAFLGV